MENINQENSKENLVNYELHLAIKEIENQYEISFLFDKNCENLKNLDELKYFNLSDEFNFYIILLGSKSTQNLFLIDSEIDTNFCYLSHNYNHITRDVMNFLSCKKVLISELPIEFEKLMIEYDSDCLRTFKLNKLLRLI